MSKVKGAHHNTWSHHETMIINLRDWVRRHVESVRNDLAKEVPSMAEDPNVLKILRSAEDLNTQLFDLIRSVVDRAEVEARKAKKLEKPESQEPEQDDPALES